MLAPSRFPFPFPPRGALLIAICALFLLPGLIGHEPWKGNDAVSVGVVHDMLESGDWRVPRLTGQAFFDNPPLYYWLAALSARALAPVLDLHNAVRIPSALFVGLMLVFLAAAARRLKGEAEGVAAPLLAIGSVGLFAHSHDAQPLNVLLAAMAASYYGMALLQQRAIRGGLVTGAAIGLGFLACGLVAPLVLVPTLLLLPLVSPAWRTPRWAGATALAVIVATLIAALWPALLVERSELLLRLWWKAELSDFRLADGWGSRLLDYASILSWFAWPALPLCAWTLWKKRRQLSQAAVALPLLSFGVALLALVTFFPGRNLNALPLLAPLVLLAVPAAGSLRRGAANAFDWFAMMTFTFFAALAWLGWSAMVFGAPARLARNVTKLEPGFVGHIVWAPVTFAVVLTVAWLALIATSPRSPYRGTVHWGAGMTLLWCLLVALWLPWIDYGRSYRSVAASLARALPDGHDCVAGYHLGDSQRASFHYFAGVAALPSTTREAARCRLALTQGTAREENAPPGEGWRKIWEGHRPGDKVERYRLYRKE